MRGWRDRIIGIVVGVALGTGVVVAFVFFLSEQTVDAPSLSGEQPPTRADQGPGQRHGPHPSKVATVRIIDGAPPASGPPELDYRKGDEIRLRVVSDVATEVELTGYGVTRTVPADGATEIDIHATRTGAFALLVAETHIDIARVTVTAR